MRRGATCRRLFGHYLVLVSFCGPKRAWSTRRQIQLDKYFDEVYFVKNRRFKDDVCKARCLDVLIDDRLDILKSLTSTQSIHFKTTDMYEGPKGFRPTYVVDSWKQVLKTIPRIKAGLRDTLCDVDPKLTY